MLLIDSPMRVDVVFAPVPERTMSQRMDALAAGNRTRVYRAKVKRDLKAGRVDVLEVLYEPPPMLHSMKVMDLLMALPQFGRTKVNKIMTRERISPAKTLQGLTWRQRDSLRGALMDTPAFRARRPR